MEHTGFDHARLKLVLKQKEQELQQVRAEWEKRMQSYDRYMQSAYDELHRQYNEALRRIKELEEELAKYKTNGKVKPAPMYNARMQCLGELRCTARALLWFAHTVQDLVTGYRQYAQHLPSDVLKMLKLAYEALGSIFSCEPQATQQEVSR